MGRDARWQRTQTSGAGKFAGACLKFAGLVYTRSLAVVQHRNTELAYLSTLVGPTQYFAQNLVMHNN